MSLIVKTKERFILLLFFLTFIGCSSSENSTYKGGREKTCVSNCSQASTLTKSSYLDFKEDLKKKVQKILSEPNDMSIVEFSPSEVNQLDFSGRAPLHQAIDMRDYHVIHEITKIPSANMNITDKDGETPLAKAMGVFPDPIAVYLLLQRSDLDVSLDYQDFSGRLKNVIIESVENIRNSEKEAQFLAAMIFEHTSFKLSMWAETVVNMSFYKGIDSWLESLLSHKTFDPNIVGSLRPLFLSIDHKNKRFFELLISDQRVDFSVDSDIGNILHKIAASGTLEQLKKVELHKNYSNELLNQLNDKGIVPLVYAFSHSIEEEKFKKVTHWLRNAHQKLEGIDEIGRTILHLILDSTESTAKELLPILLSHKHFNKSAFKKEHPLKLELPLNQVLAMDNLTLLKHMIEIGSAPFPVVNLNQKSSMHYLSSLSKESVSYLVKKYNVSVSDLNVKDDYGSTPLMEAVKKGNLFYIDYLISKNVDQLVRDKNGFMAFTLAIEQGRGVLRKLTSSAQRAGILDKKLDNGDTPFLWAIRKGNLSSVEYFLSLGSQLINYKARDLKGQNALHLSALMNTNIFKSVYKEFNLNEEMLNSKDDLGITVLMKAVMGNLDKGFTPSVVSILLQNSLVDTMIKVPSSSSSRWKELTARDIANKFSYITKDSDGAKLLNKDYAYKYYEVEFEEPNQLIREKNLPLPMAIREKDYHSVEVFLQNPKIDVLKKEPNEVGNLLHIAVLHAPIKMWGGALENNIMQLLLKNSKLKERINEPFRSSLNTEWGQSTPLVLAFKITIGVNYPQLLALAGADLRSTDGHGDTYIHYLAQEGDINTLKILAFEGLTLPIEIKNKDNKIARELADENGHDKIVEFLDSLSQ